MPRKYDRGLEDVQRVLAYQKGVLSKEKRDTYLRERYSKLKQQPQKEEKHNAD